ncbi:hypothetical protein [Leptospira stimsonii]|uniref:SMI1/KNR4 family protein n=1 Tax=Leptospira stimsonii TaxID=2202203 RepID=A0ABY2N5K7_9LEPT|nr:hypothetical protein [Leptospira stimsonii]TGK19892.1 hypothetical protein EHO98_11515 [Leptospira stimsonii]TGM17371.1 hypothetical protein EHQ90_07265 [Leptospira stimsonii]
MIKNFERPIGGLADQSIRIAIAEGLNTDEPIAFAELKPAFEDDNFIYNFVLFPVYDSEDPCAFYLLKHKGNLGDEFEGEDEDGNEIRVESDLEFEMRPVFDSLADCFFTLEKK